VPNGDDQLGAGSIAFFAKIARWIGFLEIRCVE
jgi:hypothetical protein